jgi:hypothetical protein
MLNVHELERAWLRYKIKLLLPRIAAALVAIAEAAVLMLNWSHLSEKQESAADIQSSQNHSAGEAAAAHANEGPASISSLARELPAANTVQQQSAPAPAADISSQKQTGRVVAVMKPSMDFMRDIEKDSLSYQTQEQVEKPSPKPHAAAANKVYEPTDLPQAAAADKTESVLPEKNTVALPVSVESVPEEKAVVSVPKKSTISIVAKQDDEDLKDVIRRFKKNKNPALGLFIAKRYYETNRYKKAYNYALITNDIDSKIEDSWLIFAKSLVKLDQKEMAVKALTSYVDESGSTRAKMLLEEITKGEFR